MKPGLRKWIGVGIKGAVAGLLTFVALEAGLAILCARGILHLHRPSYSMANVRSRFWIETNPDFGVWHGPNSAYRHRTTSYDVSYRANSYGARDKERTKESGGRKRAIVLGDSFTEGYGVEAADRFSDRLEAATGVEHLNFGTAGSFGPTQYYLLYKTLAKQFEHDAVMVCLLPFNDFLDDDREYGRIAYAGRYRPYFVGKAPDYVLVYSRKEVPPPDAKMLENFVREFSYTGNWLKRMRGLARYNATGLKADYSGYCDYNEDQWQRLCHVLTLIRQEANGKDVIVLTFPAVADLARVDKDPAPLAVRLKEFCEKEGIAYLDLLPAFRSSAKGWRACYHVGDPHWNASGHELAAQSILSNWRWYEKVGSTRQPGGSGPPHE